MRSILVAIVLCLCLQKVESQLIRSYGIKSGAVLAGQDWKYSSSNMPSFDKMRWGLDVGFFVEWLDIPVISVSSELHYIQKGLKDELTVTTSASPEGIGTKIVTPQIDYLSIPILVKIRMALPLFTPYVIIGPRYDLLLSTKPEYFDVVYNDFRKSDVGITLGGGCECSLLPKITVGLEYRYSMSLTDGYSTDLLKVRNRSMEFLAFVFF